MRPIRAQMSNFQLQPQSPSASGRAASTRQHQLWSVCFALLVLREMGIVRFTHAMPMGTASKGASNQELADATCPEDWIPIEPKPITYTCYRIVPLEGSDLRSWLELQALCQKTLQSHPSDSQLSVDLFGLEAAAARNNWEARRLQAAIEDSLNFSSQSTFQPLYVPVSLRFRPTTAAQTLPSSASHWEWEWRWANGTGALQPTPEFDMRAGRLLYRAAEPALRWQQHFPLARPSAECAFWTRIANSDSPSPRWGLMNGACLEPIPAPPLIVCKLTRTRTHAASTRTHAASQFGFTSTSAVHQRFTSRPPTASRQRRDPSPLPASSRSLFYRSHTSTSFEHSLWSDSSSRSLVPGQLTRMRSQPLSNSVAEGMSMTLVLALGALLVANLSALVFCLWRRCPRAGASPANEPERMRERAQSWPQSALPRHLHTLKAFTFALRKQTNTSASTKADGPLEAAWRAIDEPVHLLGPDSAANNTPVRPLGVHSSPLATLLLKTTATRRIHFADEHTDEE